MNEKQFLEAKSTAGANTICLFRMGDFYEAFYDDAKLVSKAIGLTLTSRMMRATGDEMPMAGFPYHHLEGYLRKLIAEGHQVAVCEQVGP